MLSHKDVAVAHKRIHELLHYVSNTVQSVFDKHANNMAPIFTIS